MKRKTHKYKCKYCGAESGRGSYCSSCADKLPAVRQLMEIIEQLREVKRKRDERRQLEK